MKKIFIRSPYFIEIDITSSTTAKVELYLYNKGTSVPSVPTYSLTKPKVSENQEDASFNISNYAKEFIKPIAPINITVPTEENVSNWCYMLVKKYADDTLLSEETFVCLNGYTNYLDGYNQSTEDVVVPLLNSDIKLTHNKYVDCWIDENLISSYSWVYNINEVDIDSDGGVWKLPLEYSNTNYLYLGSPETGTFFNIISNEVCEPKYTPLTCSFINRFGGWEFLTFFKASSENIETENKEYNLLSPTINYNPLEGQRKRFNFQGKQSIKCNTGWVDENYFELIQDLLLSQTVLLDNKPVLVKSKAMDKKTGLNNKNINYEIEFEYNFGLINNNI